MKTTHKSGVGDEKPVIFFGIRKLIRVSNYECMDNIYLSY